MMITGFNLAATDYRRHRRAFLGLVAACALLTVVLAAQLFVWVAQRRENQAVEARLAAMEAEFRQHQSQAQTIRAGIPSEAVKQYEAKVAAYNQIIVPPAPPFFKGRRAFRVSVPRNSPLSPFSKGGNGGISGDALHKFNPPRR